MTKINVSDASPPCGNKLDGVPAALVYNLTYCNVLFLNCLQVVHQVMRMEIDALQICSAMRFQDAAVKP